MLLLEYAWKNGRSDEEESIILSRGGIPSLGYFDTTLGSGRPVCVCVCVGTRRYWRRVTPLLSYYGSSAFSCEAAGCHCSAFEVEEEEWKKRRRKNRLRHHHHPSCAAMGLKRAGHSLEYSSPPSPASNCLFLSTTVLSGLGLQVREVK